jgi:hypothetical protein
VFGRSVRAVRTALAKLTGRRSDPGAAGWVRAWLTRSRVRWRRDDETVECFTFGDGYVATVTYADRDVTWQLTAGPVHLASALFTAGLYMQHGITPQIDPDGRTFVAVADGEPTQAFEEEVSRPVEFTYADAFRTVEEFPEYVDTDPLETAYERMAAGGRREVPSG